MSLNADSQTKTDVSTATTVDFCELLRHAADYDQKIIRVQTFYIVGFEDSVFNKQDCHDKDVWVEFEPSFEQNTKRKVLKDFKRLAKAVPERTTSGGVNWPTRMVEVIAVGRFDGVRRSYKFGNVTRTQGYGHLGGFDVQFTVLSIEQVRALPTGKTAH